MCDRSVGAAGTTRAPTNYRFLLGFSYQSGFFHTRSGIRPRYEYPTAGYKPNTNGIRPPALLLRSCTFVVTDPVPFCRLTPAS